MDEIDMGQERAERQLEAQIKKARSSKPHFDWSGTCYCGLMEWTSKLQPHFCGVECRDLYETESRMKRINGK